MVTRRFVPAQAGHATEAEKLPPVGIASRRTFQVMSAASVVVEFLAIEPSAAASVTVMVEPTWLILCALP